MSRKSSRKSSSRKSSRKSSSRKSSRKSSSRKSSSRKSSRKSSAEISWTMVHQNKLNRQNFSAMLAHKYTNENPVGKFLSEKLDGYRAFFYKSSSKMEFFSRNDKPFIAPEWYLEDIGKHLPVGTLLDGELYTKRGDFQGMGIVRKKVPVDTEWKNIKYMVFDLPLVNKPFEERYQIMKTLLKNIPHVYVVKQYRITSEKQFQDLHKQWVSEGAEGSMLRDPMGFYEHKRTKKLLKVKDFLDDEVIVESVQLGEGRNNEVMGNLVVRWAPQAKQKYKGTFDVGSGFNDEERRNWRTLFKKGTILTIRYFEIQPSGKPRFPTFQNIYHKV